MTAYCVSISGREYHVQITDTHLLVNGEPVPADLVSLNGNGMHQLHRDNKRLEVYLSTLSKGLYEAFAEGRRMVARVDSGPFGRRRANGQAADAKTGDLRAPMPGLIVEVLAQPGDLVESGQVVMIEESMKMQMQLRAPFAGRVEKIGVKPGTQVEKGALLVKVTAR
jgi:biotin carboxyl carrier protein